MATESGSVGKFVAGMLAGVALTGLYVRFGYKLPGILGLGKKLSANAIVSTAVTPVTAPVLTVAAGVISSPKVQHRISGGLDKTLYKITEKVTTANGNTLETDVFLRVEER